MKAYRKEEVDNLFNSWQNDLDQLDVVDAVAIPDGATNGDVIKALFPLISRYNGMLIEDGKRNVLFDDKWWNAPYKGK